MILYIIVFIITTYGVFIKVKNSLKIMQETSYNLNNKYFKWLRKNMGVAFYHFDIISLGLIILSLFINNKWNIGLIVLALLFIIGDTEMIKYTNSLSHNKDTLKYTKRLIVIIILLLVLLLIPFIYYINNLEFKSIFILIEVLMLVFIYLIVPILNYLTIPLVKLDFMFNQIIIYFKLKRLPDLDVIGIAGSNGKSSTLYILDNIIKDNIVTAKVNNKQFSYLMYVIKHLNKRIKYLGVELGATKVHEISYLARSLRPKYGIITNIGKNHLDTFKSQENILNSTYELINNLSSDGIVILNKDDALECIYNGDKKVLWYGINKHTADYYATNIKTSLAGSEFTLNIHATKEKYAFKTKLIGYNNIYNLLAVITLCLNLGFDVSKLQHKVAALEPLETYLSVSKIKNVTILNDMSGANPEGVRDALNIVNEFKGKKVVVTPGMINLGKEEDYYNQEFGKQLGNIDYVILVGDKQTRCIQEGLRLINYNMHNLYITNDSSEATKIIKDLKIKDNVIILLENDLSDIYSE
jgi:UDP-N-acetylmuramoyl-tripeptide--D-alanyl-D-alanine ligase